MVAYDFEAEMALVLQDVRSFAGKIHTASAFGLYGAACEGYAILVELMVALEHDDVVSLINDLGVTDHRSGLILKAWCQFNKIKLVTVEFETAICGGCHAGAIMDYRRSKKTWGNLVSVRVCDVHPGRGENALRLWFALKENNPIRMKQQTRNELKAVLPKCDRQLVGDALREKQSVFLARLDAGMVLRIKRSTDLDPVTFWRVVRNGDAEVMARLARIPSSERDRMRKAGMYVGGETPEAPVMQIEFAF